MPLRHLLLTGSGGTSEKTAAVDETWTLAAKNSNAASDYSLFAIMVGLRLREEADERLRVRLQELMSLLMDSLKRSSALRPRSMFDCNGLDC